MLDDVALEERLRYDRFGNKVAGLSRENSATLDIQFLLFKYRLQTFEIFDTFHRNV